MRNLLVLIDNEPKELEIMKKLIEDYVKDKPIGIEIICKENNKSIYSIVEDVGALIPNEELIQKETNIHIVIDICLTDDEHETPFVDDNFSGIQCLFKINEILTNKKCNYKLSLMSRFFSYKAQEIDSLAKFRDSSKHNFYAIINKPILESDKVDNGFSIMPPYADLLPQNMLSKNNIKSFVNILTYMFQEESR